jgi:hypothetical protein
MEHDHRPIIGPERGQYPPQSTPGIETVTRVDYRSVTEQAYVALHDLPQPPATTVVLVAIDQDPVQPGSEGVAVLQLTEPSQSDQQTALIKVVATVAVPDQLPTEAGCLTVYRFQKLPELIVVHIL